MTQKRRFTQKQFLLAFYGAVALLFAVKLLFPQIAGKRGAEAAASKPAAPPLDSVAAHSRVVDSLMALPRGVIALEQDAGGRPKNHKIYSVPDYDSSFPDPNPLHLATAQRLGVSPVRDRRQAEERKDELVFVASNPYYYVKRLYNSIPYLTPRAAVLLEHIGRTFLDSLAVKGVPLNTLIVTSLLRTDDDVATLRRYNGNASPNSCHRHGTTFDIAYNKYRPVSAPVRDDTLKFVLSEVHSDARRQGLCYVKYEKRQGCYHITAR